MIIVAFRSGLINSKSHNFLAAAKLKVAIATRTLTAAIAANPVGALFTVVSLAASAMFLFGSNTERAKTKLQEFNEEQARLKETTDNLLNTLYDTNESEVKRMEALLQLRNIYPDIYKDITLENLALKERNTLLKETNTLRDKESETSLKNQISSLNAAIDAKKAEADKIYNKMLDKSKHGKDSTEEASDYEIAINEIKKQDEELRKLEGRYYKIRSAKQKLLEDSWPADVQISVYEKELKDLQGKIDEIKSKIGEATTAKKEFSLTDWGKEPKLEVPLFSPRFTLMDSIDLQLLEKQAEELQAKLDKAKETKNPKKKTGTSNNPTVPDNQAAKLREQQEKLAEELLSLRRKNQQDEINLMAEGSEKKLAQIELDYKNEIAAIKKQEEEWSKAQGGKLTDKQSQDISIAYSNADSMREKGISDTGKEEGERLKVLLEKYRDFDAQRTAIEKEGNDDIAALQAKRTNDNATEIDRAIKVAQHKIKEGVQQVNNAQATEETKDNPFLKNLFGDTSQMAFNLNISYSN